MIKRSYFMHGRKHWDDGTGSHSFNSLTITRTSLFPQPLIAFKSCLERMKEDLREKPGTDIEVTVFARI